MMSNGSIVVTKQELALIRRGLSIVVDRDENFLENAPEAGCDSKDIAAAIADLEVAASVLQRVDQLAITNAESGGVNVISALSERDAEGRPAGAPAWNGNLAEATRPTLETHAAALVNHIANSTVKYEAIHDGFRAATPSERNTNEQECFIQRLADVRNELIRRDAAAEESRS